MARGRWLAAPHSRLALHRRSTAGSRLQLQPVHLKAVSPKKSPPRTCAPQRHPCCASTLSACQPSPLLSWTNAVLYFRANPPARHGTTRTASPRSQTQRAGWPEWSGRQGAPGPALQRRGWVGRLGGGYMEVSEHKLPAPQPGQPPLAAAPVNSQLAQPCCTSSTAIIPPHPATGIGGGAPAPRLAPPPPAAGCECPGARCGARGWASP